MQLCSKHQDHAWPGPLVMGVLNTTPDSFSDGGRYQHTDAALAQALRMLDEGADIIDVGGESTRPGARAVSEADELARVLPIIQALRPQTDKLISVDTSKPGVMAAACDAGADMINDVRALREPGALEAAARSGAAVCLMHMQGAPRTMQQHPRYTDVVAEVTEFLAARVAACEAAGMDRKRLIIDPGFGFGKTLKHNLQLLNGLGSLTALGLPVLVGLSRKSMFRELLGLEAPEQRISASLAAAVIAVGQGASIVRTHDLRQTREAIAVATAVAAATHNLSAGSIPE